VTKKVNRKGLIFSTHWQLTELQLHRRYQQNWCQSGINQFALASSMQNFCQCCSWHYDRAHWSGKTAGSNSRRSTNTQVQFQHQPPKPRDCTWLSALLYLDQDDGACSSVALHRSYSPASRWECLWRCSTCLLLESYHTLLQLTPSSSLIHLASFKNSSVLFTQVISLFLKAFCSEEGNDPQPLQQILPILCGLKNKNLMPHWTHFFSCCN
jgi:hypothetical protein